VDQGKRQGRKKEKVGKKEKHKKKERAGKWVEKRRRAK
jgi:hypothetical protein